MPHFRSGRQRRLAVSGQWQCPIRVHYQCTREWPAFPNRFATISESWPDFVDFRALGVAVLYRPQSTFNSWPADSQCLFEIGNVAYPVDYSVVIFEGLPAEQTFTESANPTYFVGDNYISDIDPSATITIEADVEEWFEVIDPILDSDPQGFPDYGGIATNDGLTGRTIRFYEKLIPGGNLSVTCAGLATVTVSHTVTQNESDQLGEIWHGIDRRGQIYAENDLSVLTIVGNIAGFQTQANYSQSTTDASFVAIDEYILSIQKGIDEFGLAYGFSAASVPIPIKWRGKKFTGIDASVEDLIADLQTKPGTIIPRPFAATATHDFEQREWAAQATLDGIVMPSLAESTIGEIRCWLNSTRLAAISHETKDWRLGFGGRRYKIADLRHVGKVILDNGNTLTGWSATSGITLSQAVGAIQAEVTSPGTITRSFPSENSEGHRYLSIRCRSINHDNQPITITLDGKVWNATTGPAGAWKNIELDLCQPTNISRDFDDKESRFPLNSEGKVVDSEHWGVSHITDIIISNLAAGETYQFDEISLEIKDQGRLTMLPSFNRWRLKQDSLPTQVSGSLWLESDGRIVDLPLMEQTGPTLAWQSLAGILTEIDTKSGWSPILETAFPDDYHNLDREAHLLWGGGILPAPLNFVSWDIPYGASQPVEAAAFWDGVILYGGIGDAFFTESGGSFGSETYLRTAKQLRATAWGLVLNPSGTSFGTVELRNEFGDFRGDDTVDSFERFSTQIPGGLESERHTVGLMGLTVSPLFDVVPRMRHRRVLLQEIAAAGSLSCDSHPSGLVLRAFLNPSGEIVLGVRARGSGYTNRTTGINAQEICARFDRRRQLRIWLTWSDGAFIKEAWSDDLGTNWSMATTLATGAVSFPALTIHPDGRRFTYWIKSGQVDGAIRDRSGAVLSEVTAARASVENQGLAAAMVDGLSGSVRVELVTIEGSQVVSTISTDGKTFT